MHDVDIGKTTCAMAKRATFTRYGLLCGGRTALAIKSIKGSIAIDVFV